MTDRTENWEKVTQLLKQNQNILLTTHIHPDGDGIGCEAAAYHFLKKMGKNPFIINDSEVPQELDFLNRDNMFARYDAAQHDEMLQSADLIFIFDVGARARIGKLIDIIEKSKAPIVCIDHHPNNTNCFEIDIIDGQKAATVCLVLEMFRHIAPQIIDTTIAEALYVGLLTDTGSFRFGSTTSEVFQMAAELVGYGVSPSEIYRKVYENRTPVQSRLLGMAIQNVHYELEGRLAWYIITREMLEETGARVDDVDGFTDFIRSTRGVEVVVMFLELKGNHVRLNFRSKGRYPVNTAAEKFGGGGHANAAGAMLDLPLAKAIQNVLPEVRSVIQRKNK